MLFKKTKLEFINIIPEAARLQPIEKAGAIPAWFDGLKELFLDHSGYKLVRMSNVELENTFVRVAEGAMEFDALVEWCENKIQSS